MLELRHSSGGSDAADSRLDVDRDTAVALARIAISKQALSSTMICVARIAADVVPDVDEASISLIRGGLTTEVALTHSRVAALDDRQFAPGFGPGPDAARTEIPIAVDIHDSRTDYPEFARQAARIGIRHVFTVAMPDLGADCLGVMALYSVDAAPAPDDLQLGVQFAGLAAVTLADAVAFDAATRQAREMQEAMASRAVIEQAKGIIMQSRGCGSDEAFDALRRVSNNTNRKLRDLATDLVRATNLADGRHGS